MDIRLKILELEALLLKPEVRADQALLSRLLADEYVEFGARGVTWTKAEIIPAMQHDDRVKRVILNFETRQIADSIVLATYTCKHTYSDGLEASTLRSSIWREGSEGWEIVFHQGTKLPALV